MASNPPPVTYAAVARSARETEATIASCSGSSTRPTLHKAFGIDIRNFGINILYQWGTNDSMNPWECVGHPAVLAVEHPVLPAVRSGLSGRGGAGHPAGGQERVRAGLECEPARRAHAPVAR